jgi:protein-disulfide isomerase
MSKYLPFVAVVLLGVLVGAPGVGHAQSAEPNLGATLEELVKGQAAMLEELKAIHRLLEQGARPQVAARGAASADEPTEVTLRGIDGGPVKGNTKAPLVLVEYTDYQCPFCGRHFASTEPSLANEYVDAGKLRYVVRDFPLESLHPQAFQAAEAARCAGDQGKYWEMHDTLFQNQKALGQAQLEDYAKKLGLDVGAFKACLEQDRHADAIRADMAEGQAVGVRGAPTFFLAVQEDDGKLKTIQQIRGARPYSAFKQAIDAALADLAPGAKNGKSG